ncbi:MAG: hypothetical protein KF764_26290 [Labilithrix sp.]|nr:hypothetical protein [Labilithrix sp.]MBX3221605.1 hypothetical protein [Labilithrix sp.]
MSIWRPCVVAALLLSSGLASAACGSEPKKPGKYPPQKPGCEIQVFPEEPTYQTDNIGPVQASCDESISDDECMRELKDQACKLGADTLWGVDEPTKQAGKKKLSGRAAHQK